MAKSEEILGVAPYNGTEDYIFISYSHRDTDTVLPILRRMKEAGYRFWYDEGIDPGSEWPESIADHLSRARVCLAFMSATSLASQNCRREINFALSRNLDFLSVILEPVEMSPGMEMQISTYQSILRYKYKSGEQFLERLLGVELLSPCREVPAETPGQVPAAQAPAAPAPAVSPAPKSVPKVKRPPEKAPSAGKTGKKKRLPLLLGGAVLALALIIVVAVAFSGGGGGSGRTATVGGTILTDSSSNVKLEGLRLTAPELEELAKFEKCTTLTLTGCTFEDSAEKKLGGFASLRTVKLTDCRGLTDLSWAADLELYGLTVTGCGMDDDVMATLTGGSFTNLDLGGNGLTRIPVLDNAGKITALTLDGNPLGSVKDLEGWTSLRELSVSGCSLTGLDGLQGHQKLTSLCAGDNAITDLTPIADLIYLETLDLKNNQVATLEPLQYCEKLRTVSLRGNTELLGVGTLAKSAGTLSRLDVSGVRSVTSLDFLAAGSSLTFLYAENCALTNLKGLEDHAGLIEAAFPGNGIDDISALRDKPKLRYLDLSRNALTALPDLGTTFSEGSSPRLVLSGNGLTSLANLPDVSFFGLLLDGNPLTDLSPLAGARGTYLAFDCGEGVSLEGLRETGFSTFWVTDLHLSQQADLEGLGHTVNYMTSQEAFQKLDGYYSSAQPDF